MSKTLVIAVREYLAAVKTKGFIVGLILMPLLMGGGVAVQAFTRGLGEQTQRKIAVLDRTPDQRLLKALQAAAEKQTLMLPDGHKGPKYAVESAPPNPAPGFIPIHGDERLVTLSDRVRRGDLTAYIDVHIALSALADSTTAPATGGDFVVRQIYFSTNRPTLLDVRAFVAETLQPIVLAERLSVSPDLIRQVTESEGKVIESSPLVRRDAVGNMIAEPRSNEIATVMLPVAMVVVMFMIVLVGASPLTTNIIEEKQLRIAEVLVGSVTPFTLMLGKLLGGVATSLTLGAIYAGGAAAAANQLGLLAVLTPGMMAWFVAFTIIASLMYGALFVVAGSAATNVKEAQALMTPMMLVVVTPMFLIGPLMSEPHGTVGLVGTFFPLSAPLVTILRLGAPPPMAWWQPVAALVSSSLATVVLVWIAGRVFRAGFLLVGRPAKFRELIGWIVKG